MRTRGCAVVAAVSLAAFAKDEPPRVERPIQVEAPGRTIVYLDRDVYAEAETDLRDLRVVDDARSLVPFVLDVEPAGPPETLRPEIVNRGFVPGRRTTVTLDFGEKRRKSGLRLALQGENFRRRVVVEGSDDGLDYVTLVDDAWVFAIPGASFARYEDVALPEGDHRYLRVSVELGPDDPRRVEIESVEAFGDRPRPESFAPLEVPMRRFEIPERHETLLVLDLPGAKYPFREIELDVATERFERGVMVEAQRVATRPADGRNAPGTPELEWWPIGDGVVYRYESGARRYASTRLVVSGRERQLRLRIGNRDDEPLEIRGVRVRSPRERVLFEARKGRAYWLTYGREASQAPSFDMARTIGDPADWAASAGEARLGAPVRVTGEPGASRPWSERHPALLWGGLVFVALALGGLTWRALQEA
jgi:hypothetical protein